MLAQTVILCGGLGTRLGALTATTPKPMLELAGRPFLEILMAEAARFGTREIVLLAGRFGAQIRDRYDGTRVGLARVRVLVEPEPLGTGGALRFALPVLAEDFLLMNGDSWIESDLAQVSLAWRQQPEAEAQLLLQRVPDAARYGTVEASDGVITAFREKDPARAGTPGWINAGVYVLRRAVVEAMPGDGPVSLEQDVLPGMVARGRARAVHATPNAYFIDIGLPESLARAQAEIGSVRRRPALFLDRDGTLNHDAGYTHRVDDLHWTDGAREAIALANAAGYYVFVVTNQAGVARGYYDEAAVETFHLAMQRDLHALGAHIDDIAWCPHHPDGVVPAYARPCDSRKPAPGMILRLLDRWPVALAQSVLIGDSDTDMAAGAAAGLRTRRYEGGRLDTLVAGLLAEPGQRERV